MSRYAGLIIHGLPRDHEAGFADRLAGIDVPSLQILARDRIDPGSLVAIIVADAEGVIDELKGLDWADVVTIDGSKVRVSREGSCQSNVARRRDRFMPVSK